MATTPGNVTIFVNQQALNEMLSGRSGDLRRVMAGFAGRGTRNARALAAQMFQRGTGAYSRSIRSSFPRPDELRIEANVPYAAALELGARPHPIYPVRAVFLIFYWDVVADWVAFLSVNHPGNKPYNILTDAVLATAKELGF